MRARKGRRAPREGEGRPRLDAEAETVLLGALRVPSTLVQRLDAKAEVMGLRQSEARRLALTEWLADEDQPSSTSTASAPRTPR